MFYDGRALFFSLMKKTLENQLQCKTITNVKLSVRVVSSASLPQQTVTIIGDFWLLPGKCLPSTLKAQQFRHSVFSSIP